jgi:spore coat protein CotH
MEPSHIQPVSNLRGSDGRISLRNPKAQRNGLSGALGIDFNWSSGRLDFAGVTLSNVAIRFRGNGTYVNSLFGPKQSFKVDLNKFDKEQRLGGVETLNFLNSIADNSYLHDALAQRLFRDLGVPGPRTAYAYLSLDVPGKFANQALGLYVMVENVDAQFAENRFGSKKTPIFKPVTYDLFKDQGDDWKAYAAAYDLKTKATSQQKQRVIQFARLVTSADDAEFERRLSEFLDIDEFAGFVAGHVLLSSYDGFLTNGQNYYMYLDPRTDKFGFISWDQDHGWGEFGYVATADKRENASIWEPAAYNNHFLRRVMKTKVFRDAYRRKLESALANLFTVERLYAQIDSVAPLIRPAVAAENDFRLNRFDQSISTNWITGFRGGPPEGPKAPVHQMKRFIVNRIRSVRDQLDGKTQGDLLSRFR